MPNYNIAIKQLWNDGYEMTSVFNVTVHHANGWWDAVGQGAEELSRVKTLDYVKDAEIVGLWHSGYTPKRPDVTLEELSEGLMSTRPQEPGLGEFSANMFR